MIFTMGIKKRVIFSMGLEKIVGTTTKREKSIKQVEQPIKNGLQLGVFNRPNTGQAGLTKYGPGWIRAF